MLNKINEIASFNFISKSLYSDTKILPRSLKSSRFMLTFFNMFCYSPLNSLSPSLVSFFSYKLSHFIFELIFSKTILRKNNIKRESILPSHFNKTIFVKFLKFKNFFRLLPKCRFFSYCLIIR